MLKAQESNSTIHYNYLQSRELSKLEDSLKKKFTDMNSSIRDGPFFATLEPDSLKACKVKRQAYQGGTFVGNPCSQIAQSNYSPQKRHVPNHFPFIALTYQDHL